VTVTASRTAPSDAAPSIVARVVDLGRPRAGVEPTDALGHLPGESSFLSSVTNVIGWQRHGAAHLYEQARRYGPVYRHRFGLVPVVCVTDPAEVLKIARNEDRAWSAALAWRVFFEGAIAAPTLDFPVALDFEPHVDARRLLTPAFNAAALSSYVRLAAPIFEREIDRWLRAGHVGFKREVRRLFARVAGRIFMGTDDDREAEFLDRAMHDFWGAPSAFVRNRWLSPKWRRGLRGADVLQRTFRERMRERGRSEGEDLFSRLCREDHGLDWLDDEALVRLFIGVMAAAFDTTSLGIASMGYLLAQNPEWQDKLREEGKSVSAAEIVREDAKKLPLHERAWRETMRLMPVASSLPRRALRDVEICGHRVPAGAMVLALFSPALRDPAYFPDPMRFDPERFAPERAEEKKLRGAFMPFGAGAHNCIGAPLATLEATVFWHAFLSRARIRLAKPYTARHKFLPLGVVSGAVDLTVEPS
jgi:cytochrome P450